MNTFFDREDADVSEAENIQIGFKICSRNWSLKNIYYY